MTEYEIYYLINEKINVTLDYFQIWMTLTSTLVLVGYTAKEKLSKKLSSFLGIFYIALAVIIMTLWINEVIVAINLVERLQDMGKEYPSSMPLNLVSGFLTLAVYVGATLASLYFFLSKEKIKNET